MTDITDDAQELQRALHDHLVEAISALTGVSRLVPSYRELLSNTARTMIGNAEREPSGIDIVVRRRTGTTIYVDLYVLAGHSTAVVADDVHAAAATVLEQHRGSALPLTGSPEDTAVHLSVRVLGVE